MAKVIDFKNARSKKIKVVSSRPDWTPEEIQPKIQPYIDYLNKPAKKFFSKSGDRWTTEEIEQIKQLVFKYTCECYSCTAMADEFKKYYPWRSVDSILSKIAYIRQSCYGELENFYFKVAYCAVAVRDAQMHYYAGKIEFGCYLQYRILQEAGFIPGPDKNETDKKVEKFNNEYKDDYKIQQAATKIFNLRERKRIKDITIEEAEELLFSTKEEIEDVINKLNIKQITTKNLLDIAEKMDNGMGEIVRGLIPVFDDEEKLKKWRQAMRWREQRVQSLEYPLDRE